MKGDNVLERLPLRVFYYEWSRILSVRAYWGVVFVGLLTHTLLTAGLIVMLRDMAATQNMVYGSEEFLLLVVGKLQFLPMTAGLCGALVGGLDFRHRLLPLTFLVARSRTRLLAAKAVAASVLGLIVGLLGVCMSLVLVAVIDPQSAFAASTSFVLRLLLARIVSAMLWALVGLALAIITRSLTIGTVLVVGLPFLVEGVLKSFLSGLTGPLQGGAGWLPFTAIEGLLPRAASSGSIAIFGESMRQGILVSLLVACGYLLAFMYLAHARLRDAT